MINQYKTRSDVSVKAVQFDGTNRDEIERLNYFMVSPTTEDNQLFVTTTFGDGYMNVGDYLVNIADSFIVMTKYTFNSLFKIS